MATEIERDGIRYIQPKIASWKIKDRERELFASAEEIPTWRLADKTRRMLGDLAQHVSGETPPQVGAKTLADFDRSAARQFASIAAAGIVVRSSSSVLMLTSTGYVVEAGAMLRRVIEAKLHCRAISDDESGEYALRYLQGKGSGLSKLAQKYGNRDEVDTLSKLSHADNRSLRLVESRFIEGDGIVQEGEFSVMPARQPEWAASLLYVVAYETAAMCALLVEVSALESRFQPGSATN